MNRDQEISYRDLTGSGELSTNNPSAAENGATQADKLKLQLRADIESQRNDLLQLSHWMHQNPEIRWQEYQAAERLTTMASAAGFEVETGLAGLETAFGAHYGTGSRRVVIIAEYDALEGLGHACGHNIIAASALGAVRGLAAIADQLDAQIQLLGTPAEEGGGGKIPLIDAGLLDDAAIAMMVHPGPANAIWARPLAVAHFDVQYWGHAAHASAYPEQGINAADAMTIAQVAIGMLRQQLPTGTRVHGIVRESGTAPNAIPDSATGSWYVRAPDLAQLEDIYQRVYKCFEAGAIATGAEFQVHETSPRYADFRNDVELAHLFAANAAERGRNMDISETQPPGMNTASTDMGNVSLVTRAIHPYLSINSLPAVNHQSAFASATVTAAADETLLEGAYLLAATAIDYLLTTTER